MTQALTTLSSQQKAWLGMAQSKNELVTKLTSLELQAQKTLLSAKDDYKVIDEVLAAYRKEYAAMVETRKSFTNAVQAGIIDPLMAFEKRVDPKSNEKYLTLQSRSLELRKEEAVKAEEANKKNQELARFKAHVENEFFRIAAEYRNMMRREIDAQYKRSLECKIACDLTAVKQVMKMMPVPPTIKFVGNLLTQEDKAAAYATIKQPDFGIMYNEACEYLEKVFANFDSDVANADAALKHQEEQSRLKEIEEKQKLDEETAMTTLIATAETVEIETPKIKKSVQVIVVESEQWVKAVVSAFIVNLPHLGKHIKVKKWSNLNIAQMAKALGDYASETGASFTNLQMKEVEK
jgi:hypothetical protein